MPAVSWPFKAWMKDAQMYSSAKPGLHLWNMLCVSILFWLHLDRTIGNTWAVFTRKLAEVAKGKTENHGKPSESTCQAKQASPGPQGLAFRFLSLDWLAHQRHVLQVSPADSTFSCSLEQEHTLTSICAERKCLKFWLIPDKILQPSASPLSGEYCMGSFTASEILRLVCRIQSCSTATSSGRKRRTPGRSWDKIEVSKRS